jgi:hypothetical protein
MGSVRSIKSNSQTGSLFANNQAPIELLLIGGGGGGASPSNVSQYGGMTGGAAGGLVYKDALPTIVGPYSVTIGAGGTSASSTTGSEQSGTIGNPSVFGSITAFGGGAGHLDGTTTGSIYGGGSEAGYTSLIPSSWAGGGGTIGQGNPFIPWAQQTSAGAGGSGAWAPATKAVQGQFQGGFGGAGAGQFHTWLDATSLGVLASGRRYIAGGGGGGCSLAYGTPYNGSNGGVGGGGHGGAADNQNSGTSVAAVANTGGGGGGGRVNGNSAGGRVGSNGGSGVCIVRYPAGSIVATGGTITTTGGYTYHAFTSNGTWTRTA